MKSYLLMALYGITITMVVSLLLLFRIPLLKAYYFSKLSDPMSTINVAVADDLLSLDPQRPETLPTTDAFYQQPNHVINWTHVDEYLLIAVAINKGEKIEFYLYKNGVSELIGSVQSG